MEYILTQKPCRTTNNKKKSKTKQWKGMLSYLQSHPYTLPTYFYYLPYSNILQTWMYGTVRESYQILDIPWEHVQVRLPDHGVACLLIARPVGSSSKSAVLLIFPTLSSRPHNFRPLIVEALSRNMIVVCMNKRGNHCALQTQKFHVLGEDSEIHALMQKVRELFPRNFCFGFGFSAGSIMLLRYIGNFPHTFLRAAFCMCGGYDPDMMEDLSSSVKSALKKNLLEHIVLRKQDEKNPHVHITPSWLSLQWKPAFQLLQDPSTSLMDVSLMLAQEEDEKTFVRKHNVMRALKHIRIPVMVLNSRDDPVFRWSDKYWGVLNQIKNALVVVTEKGAHGAYLTGLDCRHQMSWAEQVALAFYQLFL